jgi:signal peptidase I
MKAIMKRFFSSRLFDYILVAIVTFAIAYLLKVTTVQAYRVSSGSMEHTLQEGDFLFVWKLATIQRGEIVVFHVPDHEDYIKRCVALAGDTVEVWNKDLCVNGQIVPLPHNAWYSDSEYIPIDKSVRDYFGPYIVPSNHFFVMGDNRDDSYDSRFLGAIPNERFVGVATITYFSWHNGPHLERMFRGL